MVTWRRAIAAGLGVLALVALAWSGQAVRATTVPAVVQVKGTVVDAALKPIAKATVTFEQNGQVVARAVTDGTGAYVVAALAPGDYQVRVDVGGRTLTERSVRVTGDAKTLTLPLAAAQPAGTGNVATDQALKVPIEREPWQTVTMAPGIILSGAAAAGSASGQQLTVTGFGTSGTTQWNLEGKAGGAGRGGGAATSPMPPSSYPAQYDGDRRSWPVIASGETYAPIEANGFQPARERPLSTFGADVDTASYSNIRRFLNAGQLPPSDAVRIEELVNYFRFAYPDPRGGRPIALSTEIGDCPWAPSHKLVLIGARAAAPRDREVGRNIVLLIDVSGSMQPNERLPLIKTAFGLFVDTLRADDTVSIVTYAGTSGVALPPTAARHREQIQNAIASLSAGGSTNGGQGLLTAYNIARQAFIPGGVNRVILATDGDFNVGLTSQSDLYRLIERERDSGVFLSVFGVGTGNLKDQTMELLADHGNGHYAYLDTLQEARRVLIREGDATIETVAKDVKFQVEFNPAAVSAWKLLGYEKREMAARDFNDDRKDGGEMGAGHTVTALYEVVPAGVAWDAGAAFDDGAKGRPQVDPLKYQPAPVASTDRPATGAAPAGEWLTVKARYKLPEGETSDVVSAVARPGGRVVNLPFAAAVAEFGLLLRDGPSSRAAWNGLLERLDQIAVPAGLVADRNSFKELVATAAGIARLR